MDITKKRERHRRFWQPLEKGEGGYLSTISPIDNAAPRPTPGSRPEDRWLDVDYRMSVTEWESDNMFFGQDALHCPFTNYGPGVLAALLGGDYRFTDQSVWFDLEPIVKDWDNPPQLTIQKDHPLYKSLEGYTRALSEQASGRYFASVTDIGGQYDVLYSLRAEDMLMDLLEYPELIIAVEEKIDLAFIDYFNFLTEIVTKGGGCNGGGGIGYTSWMPLVSDTPWYPIQCDVSVMISPAMFEKFIMPALDMVSRAVGQTIYHLDGPGEIQHLDMILTLPHLHAIQWVPLPALQSDGQIYQSFVDEISIDIYKRSKKAGKKVFLYGVRPDQVAKVYDAVGSDGVFIFCYMPTKKESDQLIEMVKKNYIR